MRILWKIILALLLLFFGLLTFGIGACFLPDLGRGSFKTAMIALTLVSIPGAITLLILRALITAPSSDDQPESDEE